MCRDRRGDRLFIGGHARDQCCPRDLRLVEFAHPSVGERVGSAGFVPLQLLTEVCGGLAASPLVREDGEELSGEEVAVRVVQHEKDLCMTRVHFHHTITSTMAVKTRPIDSPTHNPLTPQARRKHSAYPTGRPKIQWPMTFTIIGILVSPTPRSTPVATACVPSNS